MITFLFGAFIGASLVILVQRKDEIKEAIKTFRK